jgi:hypothetical protein
MAVDARKLKSFVLVALSTVFSLLLAEFIAFQWLRSKEFDPRHRFVVAAEYSLLKGEYYVPALYPSMFLSDGIMLGSKGRFLPLTGISNTMTVFCNEGGEFSTYRSDRFGFNNDDKLWDGENKVILVGDSFVHGSCVSPNETISASINKVSPELRALSLGVGGTSFLSQIGIFKEFHKSAPFNTYYWFYYEGNDLPELLRESESPILRNYLSNPIYSQDLKRHKSLLDKQLSELSENSFQSLFRGGASFITLRSLRILFGTLFVDKIDLQDYNLDLFEASLDKILDSVLRDNSRLVFVYLPSIYRFRDNSVPYNDYRRGEILDAVMSRGIDYIDITPLFAASSDPLSYFPQRRHIHYNQKGYELVARTIIKHHAQAR